MRVFNGQLSLSPTDLAYFLSCRHRTALELSVAHGVRKRPVWHDPLLEALFAAGLAHERDYVGRLQASGRQVVDLSGEMTAAEQIARTTEAMRAGAEIIVQAALARGRWYGKPDVLIRVNRPSPALGNWSYEPADTKLASETRGGTILQLGLYCELIEEAQGIAPERFHVVTPGDEGSDQGGRNGRGDQIVRTYRFHDFAAYFRLIKAQFEVEVARGHEALEAANYPEPVDHCDTCPWIVGCKERRRTDDHLSLVAGISRMQRRELEGRGVITVEALGALGDPLPFRPARGAIDTYVRVRDQARVQVQSRREGRVVYELIPLPTPPAPETEPPGGRVFRPRSADPIGLARLPEPTPGDVFLDLEGDPLAADGGREYLFGVVTIDEAGEEVYQAFWADDGAAERAAFESVVDFITARIAVHPDMHVYHYAPYEPSAFKRLMGRYATREREIDELLRGRRLIDLYAVIRQGVRAGVERYSIKNLEPLYDFTRAVPLASANRALRLMEQAFELDRPGLATPEVRAVVEGYNRDDCVSTRRLRDWLEARRSDLVAGGAVIGRPPLVPGEASKELDEKAQRVEALRARLLSGVDLPSLGGRTFRSGELSPDHRARYLLAYLLDWHRREDKAGWWEYFRLRELPEEDLLEEPKAVAGLTFVKDIESRKKSVVRRFSYPEQEMEIRRGDTLKTQDAKVFADKKSIIAIDRGKRTMDLLVGPSRLGVRQTALFAHDYVGAGVVEDSLFDLGERAAEAGGVAALPPCPECALLLREPPSLKSGAFAPPSHDAGALVTQYAVDIVTKLDRTALAIQGPPGSGKTFTGARMIIEAVRAGLKVGVTATSHKVIRNLLDAVLRSPGASAPGISLRIGHKVGDDEEEEGESGAGIESFADNPSARAAIVDGTVKVLGGTAWLWARPEFGSAVDVLFVDEAGQMSLANVLGAARAAGSLVLLGDPQQLDQPSKGGHPEGVGVSALHHILDDAQTMPADRGLFLPITWRLPPSICAFTSELFYAGQLRPKPGLERQALRWSEGAGGLQPAGQFVGAGLWLVPVEHQGNRSASDEEAAQVGRIVEDLLARGSMWIDEHGAEKQLTPDDIRIVAPFNAQVQRIREALDGSTLGSPGGRAFRPGTLGAVPVGTVDKFQGQEAPVVIYSMATSHPDDAPRGMAFLYSPNRLNVATSRARCAAILVASLRLFEPDCRTPPQMMLANALCRYREMARIGR